MIEPNCDMPWEIYLDWLQDQGNEDLRFSDYFSFMTVDDCKNYHGLFVSQSKGEGYVDGYDNLEYLPFLGVLHEGPYQQLGDGYCLNKTSVEFMQGNGTI